MEALTEKQALQHLIMHIWQLSTDIVWNLQEWGHPLMYSADVL